MIHWSVSSVSSTPLSTSTVFRLRQLTALQYEQDIEHSNPRARQEHLFGLQSPLHLRRISFKALLVLDILPFQQATSLHLEPFIPILKG